MSAPLIDAAFFARTLEERKAVRRMRLVCSAMLVACGVIACGRFAAAQTVAPSPASPSPAASPSGAPTADPNAGDLPFGRLLSHSSAVRTTLNSSFVSISSSGPGATPPGLALYRADPLSPTAPFIDTPYDLGTTNVLRNGSAFDTRIDDLRQFAAGRWQIGLTTSAYGYAGNSDVARYWGDGPPFLDNPVEQAHFTSVALGPTTLVALKPDQHLQITLGAIPTQWYSTMVLGQIPDTNAGPSPIALTPFAPVLLPQSGADVKLGVNTSRRLELSALRLPQNSPYPTYALAAHADATSGALQLGVDAIRAWNSGAQAGLDELPTPVDWNKHHFIGPQREVNLAANAVLTLGASRLEADFGRSVYDPDTTRTLFPAAVAGSARRLDLQTSYKASTLEFYGVSTDPTYDPFVLNYPLFGDQLNSPWALPGPVYNSFYDLRDPTRYTSNQRTLGMVVTRPFLGGSLQATLTRAIQISNVRVVDQTQPGFMEEFYSFPFAAGDQVLGTNSGVVLQAQHLQVGAVGFVLGYAHYHYVHATPSTFPNDNLGYGQQYYSLQSSFNAGDWLLQATANVSRLQGAWYSGGTNLQIRQPQLALAANRTIGKSTLTIGATLWNYTDAMRPEDFSTGLLWGRFSVPLSK